MSKLSDFEKRLLRKVVPIDDYEDKEIEIKARDTRCTCGATDTLIVVMHYSNRERDNVS